MFVVYVCVCMYVCVCVCMCVWTETGSHVESINQVGSGLADCAAIDSQVITRLSHENPFQLRPIRIVDSIGPFSTQPLVISTRIPEALRQRIREVLLSWKNDGLDPSNPIAPLYFQSFAHPNPDGYRDIRKAMDRAESVVFGRARQAQYCRNPLMELQRNEEERLRLKKINDTLHSTWTVHTRAFMKNAHCSTVLESLKRLCPHIDPSEWKARLEWGGIQINGIIPTDLNETMRAPCMLEYYEPYLVCVL